MENKISIIANTIAELVGQTPKKLLPPHTSPNYEVYLKENSASKKELEEQRNARPSPLCPPISVVMVGNGSPPEDVNSTFLSLMAGTYPNWELILGLGLSFPDQERYAGFENVRTVISDATPNEQLASAEAIMRGAAVMLLSPGDRLSPDALFRIADKLAYCDLVYADNDYHDEFERRIHPRFKPGLSPVSELCFDYIERPLAVRRTLHEKAGGYSGLLGTDLHEYANRCARLAAKPGNIPKILLSIKEKTSEAHEPSEADEPKDLSPGRFEGSFRFAPLKYRKASVGVVIAAAESRDVLRLCLETIDAETLFPDCRLVIPVSGNASEELSEYLAALKRNKAAVIVKCGGEGTLPALLNAGAAGAYCDKLIFLSVSAQIITPDFIQGLTAPLDLFGVSVCGGKLISPDGRLYHTGTVIGLGGYAGSPYAGTEDDMSDLRKAFYTAMQRNVTAVSGCFMAVASEEFARIGMFDETFREVGWDTEFCIRAIKKGGSVVWTPYASAKLLSLPKGYDKASAEDLERCRDAYRDFFLSGDPYYSVNYDYRETAPQLAIKPAPPIKYGLPGH